MRVRDADPNWLAVQELFPLDRRWTHLAALYLSSHPLPVARAIDRWRARIDADPLVLEDAVLNEPALSLRASKDALAAYLGGHPDEICLTSNTTTALAVAYQGLIIRPDQEILTTEHDHYSHHESIRLAALRSGCSVRYVPLYDEACAASADEIVSRVARAIGPATRAVGITWVHSSTGVKLPVEAIAEVVRQANRQRDDADRCLLVVDGVHGFGTQDIAVADLGCDFFASGLHKWMLGARGTGLLWGRRDSWSELRGTVPSFDPAAEATWNAWVCRAPHPPSSAASLSPGGFLAYEHVLAIPEAVAIHTSIGRGVVAQRIAELNGAFREAATGIPGLRMHTPSSRSLSAGISSFEIEGIASEIVVSQLAERRIRVSMSPYQAEYVRVSAGIMNSLEDVERGLRALRDLR